MGLSVAKRRRERALCLALLPVALSLSSACADDSSADGDPAGETGGEDPAAVVVEVVLGARHTCARLESGSVECWGADGAGQLGNGEPREDSAYPVAVTGLGTVARLAAGSGHVCALSEDGEFSCWGQDVAGQLGDGQGYVDQAAPVSVLALGPTVRSIGAGSLTTCATTDDKVLCWGGDWFGQVGDGEPRVNPSGPTLLEGLAGPPRAIDLDQRASCVLLESGEVQCWGQCWFGTLGIGLSEPDECYSVFAPGDPVQLSGPARAVTVGDVHACALLESGSVQCWGGSELGQLGTGSFESVDVPVDVVLPGTVMSLAAGSNFTCALIEGGEVMCWGENRDGQLGVGVVGEPSPLPAKVNGLDGPAEAIAAGGWHTCAILEGGALQCWGADHRGQLGDGPPHERRSSPGHVLGLDLGPGEGLDGSVEDIDIDFCTQHADPGLDIPASLGAPVVHWSTVDQYGEDFELCDLGGRPILLDISASWCGPCQGMAAWMAGQSESNDLAPWAALRALVAEGELHWLTILIEGPEGDPATIEDADSWHTAYPNDNIPVVIDPLGEIVPGQFWASGYPGWAVIDASFRWDGIDGTSLLLAGEKHGP